MKNMDKKELIEILQDKIIASKLNVLTIDVKWHALFDEFEKTKTITKLEEEVNELLKERGGLTNEHKKLFKVKKEVMDKILVVANINMNKGKENHELIELKDRVQSINDQMDEIADRLMDLPYLLEQANKALFIETMLLCYTNMEGKYAHLATLEVEINELREQIKEKAVEKEEMEQHMGELYNGLHDVAGANLTNVLDQVFGGNDD